jgi:hypothetical protein
MQRTQGAQVSRDDLWRRLDTAHTLAVDQTQAADQAKLDRGALIEALVADGATYTDIAQHLPGPDGKPLSKQRVGQMLTQYRIALGTIPRPHPQDKPRAGCPECGKRVRVIREEGWKLILAKHGSPRCIGESIAKVDA